MAKQRWISAMGATLALLGAAGGAQAGPAWSDATISLFKPDGRGVTWVRQDGLAAGKRQVIARFDQPDALPQAAWRADARQALVWLSRNDEAGTPTLWSVDVEGSKVTKLPIPAHGRIHDLGYDDKGAAYVLTLHDMPTRKDKQGSYFQFEGKRYAIDTDREGLPVLALSYRLGPKNTWSLTEAVTSDTGWDLARGIHALKVADKLGYRTTKELRANSRGDTESDKKLVAQLTAAAPEVKQFEGEWTRMKSAAGPFYIWGEFVEFIYSSPIVVVKANGKFTKLTDLTAAFVFSTQDLNFIAPQVRGQYLLAAKSYDGKHPHLYDLKTAKLLFEDPSAQAAVFWPSR